MSASPKLMWANSLRAAATLGVIFIHSSSYLTGSLGQIPQSHWLISIIINTIVRWSVPVFVMLTGSFVLENYDNNIGPFLKKLVHKIVIPFIIWSIFYLFLNNWDSFFGNTLSTAQKWQLVLDKSITGTAVHLWYVYMIIGVYLVIPIFSKWVIYSNKKEQFLFLCFWFLLLIVFPFIDRYKNDFELGFFTGYIGYLVAGYYFFKQVQINKYLLWVLFLLSIGFTVAATVYLSTQKNIDKEMFLAPLTPGVFVMSACVYLLFKQSTIRLPSWGSKLVNLICNYSYGIYLVHLFILAIIDDYLISATAFNPLLSLPIISILCLIGSFMVIFLLRKIPFLGKWIG